MSEELSVAANGADGEDILAAFSEVSLTVEAVLGVVDLSLNDLADLCAGLVFEYRFAPEVPVELRIGALPIALAKFVEHEGRLCLQIISVSETILAENGNNSGQPPITTVNADKVLS